MAKCNKAMTRWIGEGAGRNGWPMIQTVGEYFAMHADGGFRGRGYQATATELMMAQDPMEAMTRAKEAAERGESWMTAKYLSQQQLGAGYWLDTYDADHPFTEFEHEVALRSWLMLPPIPDLPEEPCVCGETTPGQMHAMRCKVVRRALTTGRHNALQHELIGACRAAGLRVETEPVLSVTTQSTKRSDFAVTTAQTTTHFDVSVVDQGAPSYARWAARASRAAAKQRERMKVSKYRTKMVPVVFEVGGSVR